MRELDCMRVPLADLAGDGEIGQKVEEAGEAYRRGFGALEPHALARDDAGDAPSIAIRWSPRASILPPRGRVGTPGTAKPSVVARACAPIARSASTTASIRSLSFSAQLLGAVDVALAARARGEQPEERQLVDEQRHLVGLDLRRDERLRHDLDVADQLARDAMARVDRRCARPSARARRAARCGAG